MPDDELDPELRREAINDQRSWDAVQEALRLTRYWVEDDRQREIGIDVTRSAILGQLALLNPLAAADPKVQAALDKTREWVEMTYSLKKRWRSSYHSMADARRRVLAELEKLRACVEPYRPKSP